MRRLLGRLLGGNDAGKSDSVERSSKASDTVRGGRGGIEEYYRLLGQLQTALSEHSYEEAADLAVKSLPTLPGLVKETKREYGSFDLKSIPALEHGGTALALRGDAAGLREMLAVVQKVEDLRDWVPVVESHIEDVTLFKDILDAVQRNPACPQKDVKTLIEIEDGRRVATLVSWLEKAGLLTRRKRGRKNSLFISGSEDVDPLPLKEVPGSHRNGRASKRCLEIKIEDLPYVPLPRAPARWETPRRSPARDRQAQDWFEIQDASDWAISSVEKIPTTERADVAFRQIHPTDKGLFMVDDLGNSERSGEAPAAIQSYARDGSLLAESAVPHDIYRVGVNALGSGLIAMSRESIVHAYDAGLRPILTTALRDSPEVRNLMHRLGVDQSQLHTHLRTIALAHDGSRYLFSGVDEAWCLSMAGDCLWGVRLPMQEGWKRIGEPSSRFGTDSEVAKALGVMGLELPFSPEDFKSRYRQLVKQWHPDVNKSDPDALRRMQEINVSAELLSGIDQSSVASYAGATYAREVRSFETRVGGQTVTASFGMSETSAADWVYAVNFAGTSHSAYLAGYSGRIIQVDENGVPVRAYDIGAVPRRIVDTGDYLYFLTDTRLYILRGEMLVGIVDTSDGGDLMVAQTSFGLLEKKRLRWFREDGVFLGEVLTKHPIRRIYYSPTGMVVETRQRKCVVSGVVTWWE